MTSAFIYMRCSGLSQVDGDTWDRQRLACQNYAVLHDIQITAEYADSAISGKNDLDSRPALQQMIADLLSNGTKLVLIEKLDRLARMLIVQETILQDLARRGIQIISVAEPDLCNDDPTRTLIRQILGAFFEYERKMIVSKLRAARERKRSNGIRCEGRLPYGSRPDEEPLLARMLQLRSAGFTPEAIALAFNNEGLRSRYNRCWHTGTISKILSRHPK